MGRSLQSSLGQDEALAPHPRNPLGLRGFSRLWLRLSFPGEEISSGLCCNSKAYADYQAEWAAGDDGRPDWVARKTCNYLTGSIENCGNKLVESGCVSQEEVDRMKDNRMAASLQQVKDNVQSWDSTKCPPVKSYLQRLTKVRGVWLPMPTTGG